MKLRMRNSQTSTKLNYVQQATRISFKQKRLKIADFPARSETALGAGGRAFKSPRPDQTIVFSAVQSFPIVRVHGGGHLSQVQWIVRGALTAKGLRTDQPSKISLSGFWYPHFRLQMSVV